MRKYVKVNPIGMQSCQNIDCDGYKRDERKKRSKHLRHQDVWRTICVLISLMGVYSGTVLLWQLQDSWFWMPETSGIYSCTYRMVLSRLIALRTMAAALAWILIVGSLIVGCYFGFGFERME